VSTDPKTPTKLDRRVRIYCPDGVVKGAKIEFEDGEPLKNVLRAVVAFEPTAIKGADGRARVYLTQVVDGQVVYREAAALIGCAPIS
jgi:hypothetical protein